LGLSSFPLGLHFDGGIVSKEGWSGAHQLADMVGQGFQQRRGTAHPIGQRGTMQIDLVPGIDLGLTVKWQVIAIFADQHMSQKTRAGTSARNRARGQLGLSESLAAGAGHAGPHNPLHNEVARDIFQLFGDIFAELLERTAAIAAGIAGREDLVLAFEVLR
jgi:hypothetical protein